MKVSNNVYPAIFEPVGNGNWWYNYNIHEVQMENMDGDMMTSYEYECIQIQGEVTSNKVLRAILAEKYPADVEQKLINDFNAMQLGVIPMTIDEEGEEVGPQRYMEYLQFRTEMKAQIEQDCKNNGYN